MKLIKNNKEKQLDDIENLAGKICDTLKKKKVKPEAIKGKQLVIWIDCPDEISFDSYNCPESYAQVQDVLFNEGNYTFPSVVFHNGSPDNNSNATMIDGNNKEWFTTAEYNGPEIVPIVAVLHAANDFQMMESEYTLSLKDLQTKNLFQYNIGRGQNPEGCNRTNQIAFVNNQNNHVISRTLAHIEYLPSDNRFRFVPDAGGNNKENKKSVHIRRKNEQELLPGEVVLQNGDQIVVDGKFTILTYTDNQNAANDEETRKITLPEIKKKLTKEFIDSMKAESDFKGGTIIFPVAFNILMNPADFQERRGVFQRWLPGILSAFYNTIQKQIDMINLSYKGKNKIGNLLGTGWAKITRKEFSPQDYKTPVLYIPTDKKWFFQFLSCETDRGSNLIKRGSPVIYYSPSFPENLIEDYNQPRIVVEGTPTKMTLEGRMDVTKDELAAINITDQVSYVLPFDSELPSNPSTIDERLRQNRPNGETRVYAILEWICDGKMYRQNMDTNRLCISGNTETNNKKGTLIINSKYVEKNHIQIRYSERERRFELAAWGETKLNERSVKLTTGTIPDQDGWTPIKLRGDSAYITLNNEIGIEFKPNREYL